jgi:large subunit ribosomal protein L35
MSEKTHKGLKKRLKKTGRGKVMRRKRGSNHLLSNKRAKRKRALRQWKEVDPSTVRSWRKQYGGL